MARADLNSLRHLIAKIEISHNGVTYVYELDEGKLPCALSIENKANKRMYIEELPPPMVRFQEPRVLTKRDIKRKRMRQLTKLRDKKMTDAAIRKLNAELHDYNYDPSEDEQDFEEIDKHYIDWENDVTIW